MFLPFSAAVVEVFQRSQQHDGRFFKAQVRASPCHTRTYDFVTCRSDLSLFIQGLSLKSIPHHLFFRHKLLHVLSRSIASAKNKENTKAAMDAITS